MKKISIALSVVLILSTTLSYADALSNSLNNMLHKKDSPGMVNLNGVNLNGKPKRLQQTRAAFKGRPGKTIIGHYNDGKGVRKSEADKYIRKVTKGKIKDIDMLPRKQRLLVLSDLQKIYAMEHFKSRKSTAVVAEIDGQAIKKKELDNFLKKVTAGKVEDFDRLDKKQQLILVKDFAVPMVILHTAETNVTQAEKDDIFKQVWLEKQRASIDVKPEEMLALYESKKSKALLENPQAEIPPYISMGDSLKREILEEKLMQSIMQDVNISINYEENDSNESSGNLAKIANIKETK